MVPLPDIADKKIGQLAQHDQSALIRFLDVSDERQYLYHIRVAEHHHCEKQDREKTIRLLMTGIWGLVIVLFIYAGLTKDHKLPKQLLTITVAAAGGIKALKCYERGSNRS
jgi:hypothetical protein